ncbi:MAG: hypothetical protein Q9225_006263 [Loekoesia sp. 1 TL-2023]
MQKAAGRLVASREEVDLFFQANTPINTTKLPEPGPGAPTVTSKGKGKRVASDTPIDTSDRKRTWGRIISQQRQASETLRVTLSQQREVNKIVAAYREEHGEDVPSSPVLPGSEERAKSESPDFSMGDMFGAMEEGSD